MTIVRILNNNVVHAKLNGKEMVIMGKGVAFGKKSGDNIDPNTAEKVFELTNTFASEHISSLLNEISSEYWEFTYEITGYVEHELGIKLNPGFFFALLDHVYVAVKRYRENIVLPEIYMMETGRLYEKEFKISGEIVKRMREAFCCDISDNEKGFILMHIIDTCAENNDTANRSISELVNMITRYVDEEYIHEIDKASIEYSRFLIHVKYLARRVVTKASEENQDIFAILASLKQDFGRQFRLVQKITLVIAAKYQFELSEDEQCYLLIHLIKITVR